MLVGSELSKWTLPSASVRAIALERLGAHRDAERFGQAGSAARASIVAIFASRSASGLFVLRQFVQWGGAL